MTLFQFPSSEAVGQETSPSQSWASGRLAEAAIGPAQPIAALAEVTVILRIVDEVGTLEAAIVTGGFVEHQDGRRDALFVD